MYRPLAWLSGVYIAGIVCAEHKAFIVVLIIAILLSLMQAFKDFLKFYNGTIFYIIYIFLCLLAFSIGLYNGRDIPKKSKIEYLSEQKDDVTLIGSIDDIRSNSKGISYIVNIIKAHTSNETFTLSEGLIVYFDNESDYKIGDTIEIAGDINIYSKPMNDGEFDTKSYYATRNICGYIYPKTIIKTKQSKGYYSAFIVMLKRIKSQYITNINNILPNEYAGTVISIVTGDRSELNAEVKDTYVEAGFAHILAISGLHISILGMGLYGLLRRLNRSFKACAVITIWFLVVYYIFTGSSVTLKRAIIMIAITIVGRAFGKKSDGVTSIMVAAGIILYANPRYIYDASFLLSFAAGLGVVVINSVNCKIELLIEKKYNVAFIKALIFAIGIQLFIIPVQLYFYYYICPYSIIINILLLPLMSFVLVLGLLVGICTGPVLIIAKICSFPLMLILWLINTVCGMVNFLPFNKIVVGRPGAIRLCLFATVIIIFLIVLRRTKRLYSYWIVLFYLALLIPFHKKSPCLYTLYVGQGDCNIILEGNTVTMIDCGSSDKDNLYKDVIEPFLWFHGYYEIDYVFLSHEDTDHISGVLEYNENNDSPIIYVPDLDNENAFEKFSNITKVKAGYEVDIGDTKYTILYPPIDKLEAEANAVSMVVYMNYHDKNALFMGDLPGEYECEVIKSIDAYSLDKNIDILKVAHHGSKFSSTDEFLSEINPKTAVVSAGIKNIYGHPHAETIERLKKYSDRIHITLNDGEFCYDFNEK